MGVDATISSGMRALLARRRAELDAGARQVGWKVAINVPAVQQALGLDGSIAGYLTTNTVLQPGAKVSLEGWTHPALEPEIAITIGEDGAIASLGAAIELVDFDRGFDDLEAVLAGNVFHRGVVFGAQGEPEPFRACHVVRNGEEIGATEDADDPAAIVDHIASFLGAHGAELTPGDRVIAGSLVPPIPVEAGDEVHVTVAPYGDVTLRFC